MRFLFKSLFIFFALSASFAYPQTSPAFKLKPGNVLDFQMSSFDKKSGYKEWDVLGDDAKYVSDKQVFVNKVRFLMFDGKENTRKIAEFVSDKTEFSPSDNIAKSDTTLYVSGDGFKLQGDKWLWNGDKHFVDLSENIEVDFLAKRENSEEKLHISSQFASMNYDGQLNKFLFKDKILVKNDDIKITCEELETASPRTEAQNINSLKEIIARKNVEIFQEKIKAKAELARLIPSVGNLTLEGSPEITELESKASVSGNSMFFDKDKSKVLAYSSANKKIRSKAVIPSENGEIAISADTIEMTNLADMNLFEFKGKVYVKAPDFEAYANELTAEAKAHKDANEPAISKITGKGKVRFLSDGRVAEGEELEILPKKSEIRLSKNTRLTDKERGLILTAPLILIYKEEDKAVAIGEYTPVVVEIMQSENFGMSAKKEPRRTVIKSRRLELLRSGENATLNFLKNVTINSEDIFASCERMDVYARTEKTKGRTALRKIEAFENILLRQNGVEARAELMKIYPRVDIDASANQKFSHRYVELLTDEKSPNKRPQVYLPQIENIGFSQSAKNAKRQATVIVSNKQVFLSEGEKDSYIFDGDVKITGTEFNASCEKVDVEIKPDPRGNRKIQTIIMREKIKIFYGMRTASAGRADIYPEQEIISLTESPVIMEQDKTKIRGSKITYTKGVASATFENATITLPSIGDKK